MPGRVRKAAGIAFILAMMACGTANRVAPLQTHPWGPDSEGRWGATRVVEELRVGVATGLDELEFGRILHAAVGHDGTILVADEAPLALRSFDARGNFLRWIGRARQPGDLEKLAQRAEEQAEAERRVWLRNADRLEVKGLAKLERGDYEAAADLLLDALKIYEEYEHEDGVLSAAQYLGVALYEQGEAERAVEIWEEVLFRGWNGPTIYGLLVRHHTSRGDIEHIERLTNRLLEASAGRGPRPGLSTKPEPDAADREDARGDSARAGRSALDRAPATGTRILLADNDGESRGVLARLLRMEGHQVTEAGNGEEALSAVMADPPDLVLLDVYMPKLSGVDVLYQMRQAGVQTPTIVISGVANASMVRDAMVLGAAFMQKPIFIEKLRVCIEEQLGERAGAEGE